MNQLSLSKRAQIIGSLVEGNSIRATARMSGVAFNSVLKLVPEIGAACAAYFCAIFPASELNATKSGRSAMRSTKTSLKEERPIRIRRCLDMGSD